VQRRGGTLESKASVMPAALRHGKISHQVSPWRELYQEGWQSEGDVNGRTLLPVRGAEAATEAARSRDAQAHRIPSEPATSSF